MDLHYPVLIRTDDGAFAVVVPDLDGCFTWGQTVEEALVNAREAISLWLQEAAAGKIGVPVPSAIDTPYHVEPALDVRVPLLVRERRKALGLTQKQVADAMGVTYQVYQRFESPLKGNVTLKTLTRILSFLDLEMELVDAREGRRAA
jgi:predicted RNase H-like HicB family nuclease/DNA-binding XRE family transcriptional regulator